MIVRVPLASGLLTGQVHPRNQLRRGRPPRFNRHGEAFDVGETFRASTTRSGWRPSRSCGRSCPGRDAGPLALRWILAFEAVTMVIPGAKTPEQARANAAAADLPAPSPETMEPVAGIYRGQIGPQVHQRW